MKVTPLSDAEQAALAAPYNPFDKVQHEARMNSWLMAQTQQANSKKIQAYCLAYSDWKTNADIYAGLGMAVPPAPTPPVLEEVGPMPSGYWFGQHV